MSATNSAEEEWPNIQLELGQKKATTYWGTFNKILVGM